MVQALSRDDRLRGRRFGENFSDRQSSSDRERNCLIMMSVLGPLSSDFCPLSQPAALPLSPTSCFAVPMSASSASAFSTFYFLISTFTFSVLFASTETLP